MKSILVQYTVTSLLAIGITAASLAVGVCAVLPIVAIMRFL